MRTSLRKSKAKEGLSQLFFGACLSFMVSTVLLGFRRTALCPREVMVNNALLLFAAIITAVERLKTGEEEKFGFSLGMAARSCLGPTFFSRPENNFLHDEKVFFPVWCLFRDNMIASVFGLILFCLLLEMAHEALKSKCRVLSRSGGRL